MLDLIGAERRALADTLDGLSAEQWQGPTLCAGWTPGHVLAHLTMPFRISPDEFGHGLRAAGGDFTAYSDTVAARDSAVPQAELVGVLRDNADNPWGPPGGGLAGALSHDVIHGLDITWPLDVPCPIPDPALTTVLDLICGSGGPSAFGLDLTGVQLRATDLDWTGGSGEPVHGRARDLLLLAARRRIPLDRFSGDAVPRLAEAAR